MRLVTPFIEIFVARFTQAALPVPARQSPPPKIVFNAYIYTT